MNDIIGTSIINSLLQPPFDYQTPELIIANEMEESIELIYKQRSNIANNLGALPAKVFKIVYSCKDGKWNKSEPIFAKLIPAQAERYEFED